MSAAIGRDPAGDVAHNGAGATHVDLLVAGAGSLRRQVAHIERLGQRLAAVLLGGGRLLAAGNGGSAAQAQHLTAELVGRFRDERRPLSAIALHADTSSLTAIGNDYGPDAMYARQVVAHGRDGDVLVALSTSGRSANVLAAAEAARAVGVDVWGLTGPRPNPLADRCDEVVTVDGGSTATVQELHLVVIHLLCAAVDARVAAHPLADVRG
ncbi:MAG: SIS domain-containing protein [Actinobacteria bacterium]|nr:SIS domain-containing protein [Actinomycetota bacterium]